MFVKKKSEKSFEYLSSLGNGAFSHGPDFFQTSRLACIDPHVQGFNVMPLVSLYMSFRKSWHIEKNRTAGRSLAVRLL